MKKIIEGIVRCNKHALNGTLFIEVVNKQYNKFYGWILQKKRLYTVHFEQRTNIEIGTKVLITSCRPVSKTKSHIILKEIK